MADVNYTEYKMRIIKQDPQTRKSSKTKFTATPQPAKYTGSHPHLIGTEGVYVWSKEQDSFVYRPNGDSKSDWYRVFRSSLED